MRIYAQRLHRSVASEFGSDCCSACLFCQGAFVHFSNILASSRRKLPLGIAQTGRACDIYLGPSYSSTINLSVSARFVPQRNFTRSVSLPHEGV